MPNTSNQRISHGTIKAIIVGSIGNVVEWMDFGIYTLVAPFIAAQFFPSDNQAASLLKTWGAYAIAYAARPFGGLVLGAYGDKHGRNKALVLTINLMACATGAIGILPGYATLGIFAPLLLICLRLIQGLSMGGNVGVASAFLYEFAPPNRRAFATSLRLSGFALGYAIAGSLITLTTMILSPQVMQSWGWRVPFPFAFLTGLIGLYIGREISETPEFLKAKERKETTRTPIIDSLKYDKKGIVISVLILLPFVIAFVLIWALLPTDLASIGIPYAFAIRVVTVTMWLYTLLIPCWGWVADKYNRKMLLVSGFIAYIAIAFPAFRLIGRGNHWMIWGTVGCLAIISSLISGTSWVVVADQFPVKTRNTSIGLSGGISSILTGFGPMSTIWLTSVLNNDFRVASASYLTACTVLGLIAVMFANYPKVETQSRDLDVALAAKEEGGG